MTVPHDATAASGLSSRGRRLARTIIGHPWLAILPWLALIPFAVHFALIVESDNSPGRLIVADDEDYQQTRAFQKLFPEGEYVVLLAEAADPYAPEALARAAALEKAVASVAGVKPVSALSIYRESHGGFDGSQAAARDFKAFATGTPLFRKQGLVGDGVLGIPMELTVADRPGLQRTLAAIDAAIAPFT